MIRGLLGALFRSGKKELPGRQDEIDAALESASKARLRGDFHAVIADLSRVLEIDPNHVGALNEIGCCYCDIGEMLAAGRAFARAFALDDKCLAAMVNHGRMLKEQRQSDDARLFLEQAKLVEPTFPHTDAIYAAVCFALGDVPATLRWQQTAWLNSFDQLRFANSFLFHSGYDERVSEARLASEHRFWAETMAPLDESVQLAGGVPLAHPGEPAAGRRCRIGYWSPDLTDHSVRYFFRPLLENHDFTRFDVFIYHDTAKEDEQTKAMRKAVPADRFFEVGNMPDAELVTLMRSHALDAVVELAGHSSSNRLPLFQTGLATLHVTGLGYPPTTGLATMDAKVLDHHVLTPDAARYYSEKPMVLPESFWCFDPMEEIAAPAEPPVDKNGFITFGCPGNIGKISDTILACWRRVLEAVPESRLRLRAINFGDPAAERSLRDRMLAQGIPVDRVDMLRPLMSREFFASYNEIDIVLDTRPFGGGTTTAFALYMGVPVVSWIGDGLNGRMGYSMLQNVGLPQLAVESADAYVAAARQLAGDRDLLRRFRREVRTILKQTALGNGKRYAAHFEAALLELLAEKRAALAQGQTSIASGAIEPLPVREVVRRAYVLLRSGQVDEAHRIANYALRHYPASGAAHLAYVEHLVADKQFAPAVDHLLGCLPALAGADRVSVLIGIARFALYADRLDDVARVLSDPALADVDDLIDRLQLRILNCALAARERIPVGDAGALSPARAPGGSDRVIRVLLLCDEADLADQLLGQYKRLCRVPDGWQVVYERQDESLRLHAYQQALADSENELLVLAQKNVLPLSPSLFEAVVAGLEESDLLAMAGSRQWNERIDWRMNVFADKAAGLLMASLEQPGAIEVLLQGPADGALVHGMAVLDGNFLACRRSALAGVEFDSALLGGGGLLEEVWTHSAARQGLRLAVCRTLGLQLNSLAALDDSNHSGACWHAAEWLGVPAFPASFDDPIFVSAPALTPEQAVEVLQRAVLGTT